MVFLWIQDKASPQQLDISSLDCDARHYYIALPTKQYEERYKQ